MSTIRQQIIELLQREQMNARDISQALSIMEKEVYSHLEHIAKSLAAQNKRLRIMPCECLSCGYIFESRKKISKPGRCPQCKQGHIRMAEYRIVAK